MYVCERKGVNESQSHSPAVGVFSCFFGIKKEENEIITNDSCLKWDKLWWENFHTEKVDFFLLVCVYVCVLTPFFPFSSSFLALGEFLVSIAIHIIIPNSLCINLWIVELAESHNTLSLPFPSLSILYTKVEEYFLAACSRKKKRSVFSWLRRLIHVGIFIKFFFSLFFLFFTNYRNNMHFYDYSSSGSTYSWNCA